MISCLPSKNGPASFRLTVQRDDGNKIYEFEAGSETEAQEIIARFAYILECRAKT